ncbi:MAG: carboxypeptidase-like regulatory domain-containing protein [Melioribacteraceae bacterium]|nr:carboxypeptidase-like regulatory domain-containing protein [Melioribacteraceae bacterium]
MKRYFILKILVVLSFYSTSLIAQNSKSLISGSVLEKSANKPIIGVNIFISGTLWGTTTDEHGIYKIKNIPPGDHEIVFSIIGYKQISKTVFVKSDSEKKLDVKLEERIYDLDEINVEAKKDEDWQDSFKIFRKLFLGFSDYSDECELENELYIDFNWKALSTLEAKTSKPIVIKNFALGYKINCYLKYFEYNKYTKKLRYLINPQFVDLIKDFPERKEEWIEERNNTYKLSQENFLNSLWRNNFEEENYQLSIIQELSNRVMDREYFIDEITDADSIFFSGGIKNEKLLKFKNYLCVKIDDDEDLTSYIKILSDEVIIDNYGIAQDTYPYEVHGYWAKQGVANMLPKYYNLSSNFNDNR